MDIEIANSVKTLNNDPIQLIIDDYKKLITETLYSPSFPNEWAMFQRL